MQTQGTAWAKGPREGFCKWAFGAIHSPLHESILEAPGKEAFPGFHAMLALMLALSLTPNHQVGEQCGWCAWAIACFKVLHPRKALSPGRVGPLPTPPSEVFGFWIPSVRGMAFSPSWA